MTVQRAHVVAVSAADILGKHNLSHKHLLNFQHVKLSDALGYVVLESASHLEWSSATKLQITEYKVEGVKAKNRVLWSFQGNNRHSSGEKLKQ